MHIFKHFVMLLALFFLSISAHAVSIKLDGSKTLLSGTDCQAGALYRFGTENSYGGQAIDLLVEVLAADNDYNNGTTFCTYEKDKTLATNLRDHDAGDNVAFQEYQVTIVRQGTTTPVEVDRIMLTGYDLDINANGGTDTDDFYVAADGAYITSGSSVIHSSGNFYGTYTDKMKGYTLDNCDDKASTPDVTCRASAIWINGNGKNRVSTIKVRVQNDNAYGEHTDDDSYAYRLIQLSFQIEDFSNIFNGQKEYGDAPISYGEAGGNLDGTTMLGYGLPADSESSYQSSVDASGDNSDTQIEDYNDDDAVTVSGNSLQGYSVNSGDILPLNITTYGSGYLQVWLDVNGNGNFTDIGEHLIDSQHIVNTGESIDGSTTNTAATSGVSTTTVNLNIPATAAAGDTFIRVRFSESNTNEERDPQSNTNYKGEVEDYQISITHAGTISGNVKDTNNNNLAGIVIQLMDGTTPVTTATTDNNGNYTFNNIPVGSYTIIDTDTTATSIADEDASNPADDAVNSSPSDKSIPVAITNGEHDTENNFIHTLPITTGTIAGNVKDADNNNLTGITIKLMQGSIEIDSIITDTSGNYTFIAVPVGEYTIVNNDTNATSIVDSDSSDDGDTTANSDTNDKSIPVTITSGEDDLDNNFIHTLPTPAGIISGFVKTPNNQPIENASIALVYANGDSVTDTNGNPVGQIQSQVDGSFAFNNIPAGEFMLLEVDKAGYISTGDDAGDDNASNTNTNASDYNYIPVTLTAGEHDDDNLFFDKIATGSISGSVTDATGHAIEGVKITLKDASNNIVKDIHNQDAVVYTDITGLYIFTNIPAGSYIIEEEDKAGYTSTSDGDASPESGEVANTDTNDNLIPVFIVDSQEDGDNNFVDEGLKSISGSVLVDTNGDETSDGGLENVTVKLSSCETQTFASTQTDATGAFTFNNLVAGCYLITEIDPDGYSSVRDSDGANDNNVTVSLSDSNVTGVTFIDEPSVSISGNVGADTNFDKSVDENLSQVTVRLLDSDENTIQTVTTNNNGDYIFTDVTPGTYTIQETNPDGYTSLSDVDGANDDSIMITVTTSDITGQNFVDQKLLSVSGKVEVDNDGDSVVDGPLSNATLIICKAIDPCSIDNNIASTTTDENGNYKFDNLQVGNYKIIEIDKEGYESLRDEDGANDNVINVNLTNMGDITDQNFENQAVAPRLVVITKTVAKKEASIGDIVSYSISVENVDDAYNYAALSIQDTLPAGFKYQKGSAKLYRNKAKTPIDATGTEVIDFGSFPLAPRETITISYLLKVGAGVAKGDHINKAVAIQNGEEVSNLSTASIKIVADAFLDNAVVVGKVFDDQNENGIQDKGERGIPGVRLASVTGMLIETDGYGRYHVADVENSGFGGRGTNYILKVDKATLPEGSQFTTENPRVHRVTASGLNVMDFGIKLPKVEKLSKERIIEKVEMKEQLVEVQKHLSMGSVYFDSDQDCIRPDQIDALCKIADEIKKHQNGSIMIAGHTDARAPMWYNKKLAYKRAQSVYKELRNLLGDTLIDKVDVIYDNCDKEVKFNPKYDWWGKPNIPRTKKECTEFGLSKKDCNTLLHKKQGGAL